MTQPPTIEPLRCAGEPVRGLTCLAWSTDDRRLFAGTRDGKLVVWDTRTGERRQTVEIGEHVVSLVAHGGGLVVELLDFVRRLLTWRVADDGILEDLTWAAAPRSTQCERLSVDAHARDRHAIHRAGRIDIWPVEGTDGWWLGHLRAKAAPGRVIPSLGERGALHDELARCDASRKAERGLVIASRLLLVDDVRRGMVHVARGTFCRELGDARGQFFELWEAERLRRAGATELVVDQDVLARGLAAGLGDADYVRLANVATRAYNAAFDAMQRGRPDEALPWILDALAVCPHAVTWFYAGKLLAHRLDHAEARWCLDHIPACSEAERAVLMHRIEPAYLERLRDTCAEIAERFAS